MSTPKVTQPTAISGGGGKERASEVASVVTCDPQARLDSP
jgi:hypothetical protein